MSVVLAVAPFLLVVLVFFGFIGICINISRIRKESERQTDLLEDLLAEAQKQTHLS